MSRVVVVGAGVGGLAAAVRLAEAGHEVTVVEQGAAPGGKCARIEQGEFAWDAGPSLVTMPWVLFDLLGDGFELEPVEPVTRYRFADGSTVDLSADLETSVEALETWSPGAGADWRRFLDVCGSMWRAAGPVLEGPPPWPPSRGAARTDPRALVRLRPWHTLRTLAAAVARDPRLRMVIERFATYAGADPRRAPAVLALAGYVEHAFGAWYPRGGVHEIVRALVRRLEAAGGELRLRTPAAAIDAAGGRARGVRTPDGFLAADAVVANVDAAALPALLGRPRAPVGERSLSGHAVLLGLRQRTTGQPHHVIHFPADYDAEFDDVFVHRRPVRDPTLYVANPAATEGGADEAWLVLANAPAARGADRDAQAAYGADWDAAAERIVDRLGVRDRLVVRAQRTPDDLERETGAVAGAIYGRAPHGRLGTLRRPGNRVRGVRGLWLVGGTVHPGGGLPLVMLGAARVARELGGPGRSRYPSSRRA